MNLPQLPQDQANHYVYGTAAAIVGAYVARAVGVDHRLGAVAGAVLAGVGKEVYDRVSKKGTPDVKDIVATAAGALPVVLV